MNVKQVQNDTLSHFVLSRASTFSLAATGDLTYSSECIESSQIYMTNSQEVNMIILKRSAYDVLNVFPDFRFYHSSVYRRKVLSGVSPSVQVSLLVLTLHLDTQTS